uniref:Uncharacterized protein n=1 Tax=Anguilla anguilla TaxID=7936 RepID=A0A0E9RLV6_ANGAN
MHYVCDIEHVSTAAKPAHKATYRMERQSSTGLSRKRIPD